MTGEVVKYSEQELGFSWGDDDYVKNRKKVLILVDVDNGGGYEWDQFDVVKDLETGLCYLAIGSGCSCNYLWDDYRSIGDFGEPVSFRQAVAKYEEWVSTRSFWPGNAEEEQAKLLADGMERLMKVEKEFEATRNV